MGNTGLFASRLTPFFAVAALSLFRDEALFACLALKRGKSSSLVQIMKVMISMEKAVKPYGS